MTDEPRGARALGSGEMAGGLDDRRFLSGIVDRRPATLLLRSFSDDEKLRALRTSQYALFDFSLEGRLAGHFAASGPFIAVGSPSHETPPAGAARAFLSDDEWQGRVGQWMQSARLIIVVAGLTKWVEWELDQVVKRGYVDKLIVLFPEKAHVAKTTLTWRPPFYVRSSNAVARLEGVRTACCAHGFGRSRGVGRGGRRAMLISANARRSSGCARPRGRSPRRFGFLPRRSQD